MNKTQATGRANQSRASKQAEAKEIEKIEAIQRAKQEEEQKEAQEALDLQEFQTMPRINLQLKSAFGINDNLAVNDIKIGTTFQFLQTPGLNSQPTDDVQLIYTVGRQIAIRNTETNQVQMLPIENASHQITAINSSFGGDFSRIAMAEQDFSDPSLLYFSIFEVKEHNQIIPLTSRIRIDMPSSDEDANNNEMGGVEESKARGSRTHQEFSSAAASSPLRKNGQGSVMDDSSNGMPFVSQICFSANFVHVACLISGSINKVIVYEIKAGKVKPVASETFPIQYMQEVEPTSPNVGDQSRITDKSKTSVRSFYHQSVTQISFNPGHSLSLCMTGTGARLDYRKILVGCDPPLEPQYNPKFEEMSRKIKNKTITCHAWSPDGLYFGICTENGIVIVYKLGSDIVFSQKFDFDDESPIILVSIQLFEYGMVVASSDGSLYFFENVHNEGVFEHIRHWKYRSEELKETPDDVVRGVQVLDQGLEMKVLSVQLANRNVLMIDMMKEVYLQDKRDDIRMKLQEHQAIEDSLEEQARFSQLGCKEKREAKENREREKENITAIGYKLIGNGFHSGEITEMHACLQRPILLTMSYEDQYIRLWNYEDNKCELEQNFALGLGDQKPLVSCALHPSGYYMAVALADQIRLYHILHPDLKEFNSYDHKNTKRIRFSSGGQYFVAIDGKNMRVFSTYSLEQVKVLQIPPSPISTISFNFNDSRLVFISEDGQIQSFDLEEWKKVGENRNDRTFSYKNAVFVQHESNASAIGYDNQDTTPSNLLIAVGTQKDVCASLRIFKDDEMKQDMLIRDENTDEALSFTDIIKVVSADNLVENLVIGSNRGSLSVYGMPPRFLREDPKYKHSETVAHLSEISALQASCCGRYVFSAGKDGIIFVFDVVEHVPAQTRRGQNTGGNTSQQQQSLMNEPAGAHSVQSNVQKTAAENGDTQKMSSLGQPTTANTMRVGKKGIEVQDELGRIVLVGKGLMEDWRKMQETLRTEMEKQQEIVDSSLRAENFQFIQRNNQMEKEKTKKLNILNGEYETLQMKEAEQKDENQQSMNKLEINHNQCKEELQDLYEAKLVYEQDQFGKLKEDQNGMRKDYESQIKRLNDCHDADVEELLDDFKVRLQDVQGSYEDSKKVADDLKMKNEEKLTSQEQDQLHEITELTEEQKKVIDTHAKQISEQKNMIEREKWKKNKIRTEIAELQKKTEAIKHITKKLKTQGKEHKLKITDLDQAKKDATANLKKKEDELFTQKFKIKDLQKTKQVLTHRTFEMKASLEPKEQQIESLKQNLHDLEKLFDMQAKSLLQMEQNVNQKKDSIGNLELQRKKAKSTTKKKELLIQEFVQDIQKTMQMQDDADKMQGFMKIYQKRVKQQSEDVMTKKQKDPELIDQLDKHLKYMEKQIRQLQETSSKNLKKAKEHIHNRTEENKGFIEDLYLLRKKDNKRKQEQSKVDKKITEIQLAKRRIGTDIEKMREEMQKMKLRDASRPGLHKASSVYTQKKDGDDRVAEQFKRNQSRGRLIKGSLFNNRPAGIYKQQIQDLLAQLNEANEQIVIQQLQITTLRDEFSNAQQDIQDAGSASGAAAESGYNQRMSNELQNFQMLTEAQQQQYLYNQMAQASGHPQQQMMEQEGQQSAIMDHSNQMMGQQRTETSNQDLDGQPKPANI